MYVTILSGALELWDSDLADEDLVDYVRICRAALPERDLGAGVWSETALVAEISYDRALVCLAAQHGIDVTPTNFVASEDRAGPPRARTGPPRGRSRRPRRPSGQPGRRLALALELGGVDGGFGAAGHLELAQQAGDVVLHRVLGEEHRLGDLLVGLALRDEVEDARLLGREGRGGRDPPWAGWRCARPPGRRPSGPSATPLSPPSSRPRSDHGP